MRGNCGLIDNKAVGKRIRKIRESNKLTQEEMAEILSVNPNAIRAYERGEYGISKDVMVLIRHHFHVSIDYLLFGAENDWDYLLLMIENASEEDKMKALIRLAFYFAREKERSFNRDTGDDEIANVVKKICGDMW